MAEYDFHTHYQGPRGPHLNRLTYYSLKRKPRDIKLDRSIHLYGRRDVPNTCKPKKRSTVIRSLDGVTSHLERHPHDVASQTRKASLEAKLLHAI